MDSPAANLLGCLHEADRARSGGDRRGLRLRLGARVHRLALLPGAKADPCSRSLSFTSIVKDGSVKQYTVGTRKGQPVDCFYVYPSVSTENRGNSDLKPGIEETDTARLQASWFSPICRVFAPMYRQVTTHGDGNPYHGNYSLEYEDVLAAWRDYLAHSNHGRGVVLIGHSEGSFLLKRLIQEQIENVPKVKRLLVSAVLLGGNVRVGNSSAKDGDFPNVPPCTSTKQFGCVVAYSTYDKPPPATRGSSAWPTRASTCSASTRARPAAGRRRRRRSSSRRASTRWAGSRRGCCSR